MKNNKELIIFFENEPFIGELIQENSITKKKLYQFDSIPYIDGNDNDEIKKEFPNMDIPIGEFLNHTYIIQDDNNNIKTMTC